MKTKYQRMSKEEKKELLNQYKNTEKGKYLIGKLNNVFIIGIISYVYAAYMLFTAKNIWNYIAGGSLIVSGCIFVVASVRLRKSFLTKFAVNGYKKK